MPANKQHAPAPSLRTGHRSPIRAAIALTAVALLQAACAQRSPAAAATAAEPAASRAAAQATTPEPRPITEAEIDGYLRFLSSDLLEGRGPSGRGGKLTVAYLESQMRAFGLEPAGENGGYTQSVPIDAVTADASKIRVAASGRATDSLTSPDEVVVWAGSAVEQSAARGELVFVGYGVTAPEQRWDDFKNVDVRGKVLLVLVNDPPATSAEPELFGGNAMTYYGRWTYKFEEAERRGAAGMLIVHTTEQAGYPWHTVVGSWAKEQLMLPRKQSAPAPLGVRGWIAARPAASLLRQAGLDLPAMIRDAASRDFRPVATGIEIDMAFPNTVRRVESENVVAAVPGSDPVLRDEYVILTSHWDHLGIGPAVNGDSIYNGASDNASGVSDLLAIARVLATGPAPRRSLLFTFVTAEESGLLGSAWFAENPTVPLDKIAANVNVDGGNLIGPTTDMVAIGEGKSSMGPLFSRYVSTLGLTVSPEERPEAGIFYRSDHFSFAKAGVPALFLGAGLKVRDRPEGWGQQQSDEFTANRYHQPGDEYRPDFDLRGAVQLSNVVLGFVRIVADAPMVPTWNADAEFQRASPVQP
ncbi:MAG TPA: M28 family peptidase [Gemmatimonadales bacterium]|nr:M28 family peptidase [Gemmatimonadales bacterium]